MNEALGELKMAMCACAATTCSLSCGTGDRTEDERSYFGAALFGLFTLDRSVKH